LARNEDREHDHREAAMTDDAAVEGAVDALARQVIADQSPAELPLFAATAERYHADPASTLSAGSKTDETLGFGVETAVVLLTPFALDLVKRIFTQLAEKLGDSAANSLAGRVSAMFHRDASSETAEHEPPALSAEQLALVSQTAREQAKHLRLPSAEAEALANGVVAALATRT
jgi:hypothetical protein